MTKRAAIYSRVSTKEQADHGTSQTTQEAAAREYAKREGYEVVERLVVQEVLSELSAYRVIRSNLIQPGSRYLCSQLGH